MADNSFKVIDMVTKESLRIAHEALAFIGTIDRQYDPQFKDTGAGKKGSVLRVRLPNMYTRRQGSRVMDVQDQDEKSANFTLATQDGVDMRFNSAELIQSVNSGAAFDDLSKNYISPAIKSMCSGIESDFIALCTKATYNTAGTAGTPPVDLIAVGAARAKLNQQLAPKDGNRFIMADSVTMGGLVNGLKGLFHDSGQIREQYREGMMGRTAMADWYENDRMWTMTNGSDVTGTTDAAAAVTDGGTTLSADTAAPVTYTVGQVFTISGVFDCHPETKAPYATLKQFTNTAGTGSGGDFTISPPTYLTGPRKNVCTSTGADLTTANFNSQTLTAVGNASTSYLQNLMYHKEAYQFVTADLPLLDDAHKCQRISQDGLSLRVWMASDIRNDELLMRVDILYGMAALRPEWACRITN
jgi:hypothetical protein